MAGRRCFDRALHGGMWWPWLDGINQTLCLWWWLVALFMLLVVGVLLVVGGSQHAFGGWWLSSCSWWPADVMLEYGWGVPGSTPCTGGGGSSTCSSRLHALPDQPLARSTSGMDGMDKAECAPMDGIDFNINYLLTTKMTTLLITPTLNSTNQVATSFALHLLKSGRSYKRQLFALVSPKDGTKISKSLEPYLEGGQLNILFGSCKSQKIVKRVVEVNKIRSVFVIIDEESNIPDEETNQGLASKTRLFLTSLCSLLDCLRQTNAIPSIVVLFHSFGTVKEEFLLPHLDICLPLHPIVQCKTEKSARFSSLHALCHAFAVSYKMNIQIGLVMETTELICNQNVFLEFEALASLKSEEKSEINFFEIGRIEGDEEIFTFTRLLLFSNVKLEEQQKQQAIQSLSSLQNDFFRFK
uniref:Uncharacterized protein n=1 Tax=Meloidogyne enterolobii TaxID=390850 RepID=A0A6V7TPI9_MELEN|nr:unnamed protein product [Meloidogyne enterolobii]